MTKDLESNDPFELVGVTHPGTISEETDRETGRCIVEEYALTGFAADEILALFSSSMFELPYAIYRRRSHDFVVGLIGEVFGGAR
jgi:hypothetical protein